MVTKIVGHVVERREQVREGRLPGIDQRVLDRHSVEGDFTVIGVDNRLHRVADIVEIGAIEPTAEQLRVLDPLAVGVAVGRRVAVDHVVDTTVEHHRVGIRIELEERSERLDTVVDVADIDHAGVVGHEIRDQRLDLTEPHRERSPPNERPHTDTRVAVVANRNVLIGRAVDIVDFVDRGADEGVPAKAFTVVDLRLIELKGECRIGLDRQTTGKKARAALRCGGVRAARARP